jgi:hypothetical protein
MFNYLKKALSGIFVSKSRSIYSMNRRHFKN